MSDTARLNIVAQDNASATLERVGNSTRNLITGFSGLATASFSLYQSFDRYSDMAVSVDRANLAVKTSQNSLEDAQRRYNTVLANSKSTAEQVKAAKDDLALAEERVTVAVDRATMIQDNQNEALIQMGVMITPTAITMVDSLSRAWKNFPDMSATLQRISTGIGNVGSTAATAAIGVGSFVSAFLIGYTVLNALPENLRGIASAVTLLTSAVIAGAVAWLAYQGTVTMGVAVPVILASIGAGIAALTSMVSSAPKLAEGGIVARPTLALVGERGPEAVIPLGKAAGFGNTVTIGEINIYETKDAKETAREVEDKLRAAGAL